MSGIGKHFWLAVAVLSATLTYTLFLSGVEPIPPLRPLGSFPERVGGFRATETETFNDAVMEVLGVDSYVYREYRDSSGYPLWLYVGYYQEQSDGSIIHSPKHCMPGSGWDPVRSAVVQVDLSGNSGVVYTINQMVLQKGLEKQLAHYWFQGRGRVVADEYADRAYLLWDSILHRRSDGALIRITGPGNNLETGIAKQQEFARAIFKVLEEYLPQ